MTGYDEGVGQTGMSPVIVAAHELKTPLVLLRQLALSLEHPNLSEPERARALGDMRLVSERALRLTTDLTKSQRLEDALFEMEPVNPYHVFEEVLSELSPLYTACGRTIVLTAKGRNKTLLAVANQDLLRRILLNFADNALHHTDQDTPVQLRIQARGQGEVIRLGVRDFGPSLPPNVWGSVSGQVQRSESIHARPMSSGLGLMIVRRFAEVMGASVGTVRHRDGATFFVDLQTSKQLSLL